MKEGTAFWIARGGRFLAVLAAGGCLLQVGGCLTGTFPVWMELGYAAASAWAFSSLP